MPVIGQRNRRQRPNRIGQRPLISRGARNAITTQPRPERNFNPRNRPTWPIREQVPVRQVRATRTNPVLQAGEFFNKLTRGLLGENNHQRQALADLLGGQRNEQALAIRKQPELFRRGMVEEKEMRVAMRELERIPKRFQKLPPTQALRELKAFFIEQLFDPQGEIKSFSAMREFLKEKKICAAEGDFQTVFNHMFSLREKELLEKVFGEQFNDLQSQTIWNHHQ